MLDGKLRISPTCYHVLHLVPVMTAHEMNFFYDEGLRTTDGSLGYEISTNSMVPFGLEKLGISQAMKGKIGRHRTRRANAHGLLSALAGRRSLHYRGLA